LTLSSKLANSQLPIPVSFIYSDLDWTYKIDGEAYKLILEANKFTESQFHMIPGVGHNLFLMNPNAVVNTIFNDVFGSNLPVLKP
jgi:pimeloyl-ACP methyl ester carboxylesterase